MVTSIGKETGIAKPLPFFVSSKQIAKDLGVDMHNVVTSIAGLVRRGLVLRTGLSHRNFTYLLASDSERLRERKEVSSTYLTRNYKVQKTGIRLTLYGKQTG